MEGLPNQNKPPRLRIIEQLHRPDEPVRMVLGGTICSECSGTGLITLTDPVSAQVCRTCAGSGEEPGTDPGVDILQHLETMVIELSGHGAFATIALKVDLGPFDFHLDKLAQVVDVDPLEGLTGKELEQIVANCPASQKVGDRLLEHLQARAKPE